MKMDAKLSNFFQFSLTSGLANANIVANSAFQFVTEDSILKVMATLNAAANGCTIQVQVTDSNMPTTPYPASQIPIGQVAGSVTEFDPMLAQIRVRRGANVVITVANGAAGTAAGQVWVGLL